MAHYVVNRYYRRQQNQGLSTQPLVGILAAQSLGTVITQFNVDSQALDNKINQMQTIDLTTGG